MNSKNQFILVKFIRNLKALFCNVLDMKNLLPER